MRIKELVQPIKIIMEGAAKLIIEIYESKKNIDVQRKNDDSPLTIADLRSNELISDNLKKLFPNVPIISEEGVGNTKKEEIFWLIDPLDGTKEFIQKSDEFTINIALIKDGKPIFGAIYIPIQETFIVGGKDLKAFSENNGEKRDLKTSFSKETCRITLSKQHQTDEEHRFMGFLKNKFKKVELFPAGSSLKICLVASGDCHIYPRFGDVGQWDIAAGHAILKASGGNIVDLNMNEIKYNTERTFKINGFYALSNEAFFSQIIQ